MRRVVIYGTCAAVSPTELSSSTSRTFQWRQHTRELANGTAQNVGVWDAALCVLCKPQPVQVLIYTIPITRTPYPRQADASTADEMGVDLDEHGNITKSGREDMAAEMAHLEQHAPGGGIIAGGNENNAPEFPDPSLFVLRGRVITTWEQSKVRCVLASVSRPTSHCTYTHNLGNRCICIWHRTLGRLLTSAACQLQLNVHPRASLSRSSEEKSPTHSTRPPAQTHLNQPTDQPRPPTATATRCDTWKAALDACWSETEAWLTGMGCPQPGVEMARAEWDRQAADTDWCGDNHPRAFYEWVNNDYGCCSEALLEMFARQ